MASEQSIKRDVVEQLSKRVETLIRSHKEAKERIKQLERSLEDAQKERIQLKQKISDQDKELTIIQLTPRGAADEAVKDDQEVREEQQRVERGRNERARSYINKLLREVDECIALISTPIIEDEEQKTEK